MLDVNILVILMILMMTISIQVGRICISMHMRTHTLRDADNVPM